MIKLAIRTTIAAVGNKDQPILQFSRSLLRTISKKTYQANAESCGRAQTVVAFAVLHRHQERFHTMRRRSFITLAGGTLPASISRPTQATPGTNRDELILPRDSQVRTGGARMCGIVGGFRVLVTEVGNAWVQVLLVVGGARKGSFCFV